MKTLEEILDRQNEILAQYHVITTYLKTVDSEDEQLEEKRRLLRKEFSELQKLEEILEVK